MALPQSQQPRNGELRYPVILPKIPPTVEEQRSKSQRARQQANPRNPGKHKSGKNKVSGCYIPKCSLLECNLSTHRRPPWMQQSRSSSTIQRPPFDYTNLDRIIDGLPSLPDPTLADGEVKELFHQFFSYDLPRLAIYLEPPSVSPNPKQVIHAWQHERLELSLSSPLFMLVHVCLAHINRLVRCEQLQPANISVKLYGCLLRLLRQKLEDFSPNEAPELIIGISPLVIFDITLGQKQAVANHRLALQKLLQSFGLYNHERTLTSHSISYLDLLTSTSTNKPPLYVTKPNRTLHQHFKLPCIRFDLDLDHEVADICEDICHAVAIVEQEGWNFQPGRLDRPYNAAEIQYMYFLRNNIGDYIPHILMKELHNPEKSRPILLAALIVDYLLLHLNYLPFWLALVANDLLQELESQNLQAEWNGQEDVLCWLMCVLSITPKTWDGRTKALEVFGRWLMLNSPLAITGSDSGDNILEGLCDPEDFVWASALLDHRLKAALKEIEELLDAHSNGEALGVLADNIWLNL